MSYQFTLSSSQYLWANLPTEVSTFPVSIVAWVKSSDTTNLQAVASLGRYQAGNHTFYPALWGSGSAGHKSPLAVQLEASTYFAEAAAQYPTSGWFHVAAVFASSTDRKIYLDGGNMGQSTTSVALGAALSRVAIGARVTTAFAQYMNGNVAEVGVYAAHALSPGEIASLAAGKAPELVSKPNLTYYWPLKADGGLTDEIASLTLAAVNGPVYAADHPSIDYGGGGIPGQAGGGNFNPTGLKVGV